jgi:pimeloyl-ACP methyl ester carboxylesterase
VASKASPSRRIPITVLGLVLLVVAGGAVVYFRPVAVFRAFQSAQLRLAGVESHEVTLGGHRIHYRVRGPKSGMPIVLVHGLAGSTEDWINLSPYLDRAGYRVYMIDLLGFGQSEQPPDARYSISEQAALVVSFLDAMQIKQTDLAGWSMGGWIVQRVAIEHPERVRRIALIDSAGLLILPDWDTRLFTPATPQQLDQLDALLMPHPPMVPGFVARDIIRESNRNAWVVHRALASMLSARDVTDAQLPTLRIPVLLLWGDRDRITPLSEGRSMHRLIAQSRLEIATGCGHMAPEQCAAVYGPELVRFLQAEPSLGPEEGVLKLPNEMYIAR